MSDPLIRVIAWLEKCHETTVKLVEMLDNDRKEKK